MHTPPSATPPSSTDAAKLPNLLEVPEDERDRVWFEHYYQGDHVPQLTARAVVMGMVLGGVMSLSNLYVGLKTGWGLGVAITACILSYAIWSSFVKAGLAKTNMSVLENNCMQSTASSAGYSTGGTMVSAIAAYLLITGENMPFGVLACWTAFLALLGVSIAVPMKRQMINREQLAFPSGIAAAETLRSLHAAGGEAILKARALFGTMALGALIKWFVEGNAALMTKLGLPGLAKLAIPAEWTLPVRIGKRSGEELGLGIPVDPIMVAGGALVGLRTSISMAVGAVAVYAVLQPWLDAQNVFVEMKLLDLGAQLRDAKAALAAAATPEASAALQAKIEALSASEAHVRESGVVPASMIRKWALWSGSAMMVTGGLTAFAFQWRSIVRAFAGLGALFSTRKDAAEDPLARIEVPNSWFAIGTVVSGAGCVAVMQFQWGIAWYWGILSIGFAFVLSLVACRATGETDITPIGAMGKVTQLFYGVTLPQNATANLMTAGVTAGAAGSAADLLTDLKSGYLLGANPRKQAIAQALGIIAGTLVVVPVWYVLVPNAQAIGAESKNFPAPSAEVWASVAKLLANGLDSLHPTIRAGMAIGAVLGILLTLVEQLAPAHVRKWVPSATGLGLACVINFSDSIAFLLGALIAWAYEKRDSAKAELYVVPVSSGIIAGESIMGIVIALSGAFGFM
jgi:OPT family oligopeptide transporter